MFPIRDNIPSYRKPIINYFIIFLNSCVFIYQSFFLSFSKNLNLIKTFGFTPLYFVTSFPSSFYTLITSMFLHGNFVHFLGNMWFLYIFGDNVEDKLGHIKYFLFYLICGILATLFQFLINPLSQIPMIGASGAISGVLGAYFVFYPSAGILTVVPLGLFFDVVVIPSVIFLGFWFIFQFLSGTTSLAVAQALGKETGGIAYWAHIGGFVVGIILAIRMKKRKKTYWRYL